MNQPAINQPPMLAAASYWAGKGFPVFPLRRNLKTPATADGFKSATTEPPKVQEWFGGGTPYNIGLKCGVGLLVIDIDVKGGVDGVATLVQLEAQHGQLPPTLTVATPSGGKHLYFRYPAAIPISSKAGKIAGQDAPGLDVRADGGYVVVPPSSLLAEADPRGKTATGEYTIIDKRSIADLPAAWVALLVQGKEERKPPPARPTTPPPENPDYRRLAELQDALTHIDPQPYDDWVKVGMALYSLGNEGLSLWGAWSRGADNYDAKEIPKRWKTFANTSVNVESVFHMATAAGWQNPAKGRRPDRADAKPASGKSTGDNASTSATDTIDKALELAEQGNYDAIINKAFTAAVQAIRGQDEDYYLLNIKPRIKKLKAAPITVKDMDKLTTPPKQPKQRYTEQGDTDSDGGQPRQGKADLLIDMVNGRCELFCDESGKGYASFDVEPTDPATGEVLPAHRETWALESKQFRQKMGKEFRRRFGIVAGETAMKEATDIITADADESPRQSVCLRYAPIPDAGVYVDLCNEAWEVVEVTPAGWRVIPAADCQVKFRRVQHSMPLPTPVSGGDIADLWKHINVQGDDSRLLVLAWLLDAMRVTTHYPVLELVAGQGSAKSTTQDRLRALIDPNAVMLRIEPRSNQDLSISAVSNHVISLNNLSHLSTATQDFMCSMSTGGGDAARRLYTTDDEAAWDTKRPVVMNGINQLVTRPDLADRTICVELQKVEYVDDTTLKAAWDKDYPAIVGALYSLLSATLRELPGVQVAKLPRMGDFAKLGVAMVRALGMDADFVAAYNRNRDEVVRRGVDSSPVALALVARIRAKGTFEGSTGELMTSLEDFKPLHYDKAAWPKSPRGLGEMLRRLAPALLVYGVSVEQVKPRKPDGYHYCIQKIDKQTDTVETEL